MKHEGFSVKQQLWIIRQIRSSEKKHYGLKLEWAWLLTRGLSPRRQEAGAARPGAGCGPRRQIKARQGAVNARDERAAAALVSEEPKHQQGGPGENLPGKRQETAGGGGTGSRETAGTDGSTSDPARQGSMARTRFLLFVLKTERDHVVR